MTSSTGYFVQTALTFVPDADCAQIGCGITGVPCDYPAYECSGLTQQAMDLEALLDAIHQQIAYPVLPIDLSSVGDFVGTSLYPNPASCLPQIIDAGQQFCVTTVTSPRYPFFENATIEDLIYPKSAIDPQGNVYTAATVATSSKQAGVYIQKTDPNGNQVWGFPYAQSTGQNIIASDIKLLSNNHLVLEGLILESGVVKWFLAEFNTTGQLVAHRDYNNNFSAAPSWNQRPVLTRSQNGNFNFLVRENYTSTAQTKKRLHLLRQPTGNYTSGSARWGYDFGVDSTRTHHAITTADGGLVMIGRKWVKGIARDFILKVEGNANGNVMWSLDMDPLGKDTELGLVRIREMQNGDLLFLSSGGSSMFRLNSGGGFIWGRSFLDPAGDRYWGGDIQERSNGDILQYGYVEASNGVDYEPYLLEVSSNGSYNWNKTYDVEGKTLSQAVLPASNGIRMTFVEVPDLALDNQPIGKGFDVNAIGLLRADVNGDIPNVSSPGFLNEIPFSIKFNKPSVQRVTPNQASGSWVSLIQLPNVTNTTCTGGGGGMAIVDTCGFYCELELEDFGAPSHVIGFENIQPDPNDPYGFFIDVVYNIGGTHTIHGSTSCYLINDCQELVLCDEPLFAEIPLDTNDCEDFLVGLATHYAEVTYGDYIDSVCASIAQEYIEACLDIDDLNETFDITFDDNQYHYTLYYYDQGSDLVQTVPPKGVALLSSTQVAQVHSNRVNGNGITDIPRT